MHSKYIYMNNCIILSFDTLESTQIYCIDNLNEIKNRCNIVSAENQTRGIGRHNTFWQSSKGACTFSVIFNFNETSLLQFNVLHYICEILEEKYTINAYIKWPNDIYIDKYKICGIIIDIKDNYVIVGVGINICTTDSIYKSIKQITNCSFNKFEFMNELITHLKNRKKINSKYLSIPDKIKFNGILMLAKIDANMNIILTDDAFNDIVINKHEYSYDIINNEILKKLV